MKEIPVKIGRRTVLAGLMALTGGCSWPEPERVVAQGSPVRVPLSELQTHFQSNRVLYVPEARAWVVAVEAAARPALAESGDSVLQTAADTGYLVLHQKCTHLGCRVPACETSGLFECPCHGARYTRFGEKLEGPQKRGLDRFSSLIDGDDLLIETSFISRGLPEGFHPSGETALGPHCI